MKAIQFINTSPEELLSEVDKRLDQKLDLLVKNFIPKKPKTLMTRQEVANFFSVDISTIHNWCKNGKLNPLGKGHRVYFDRIEVENSLTSLKK